MIIPEGGLFDRSEAPIYFSAGGVTEFQAVQAGGRRSLFPRHMLTAVNDMLPKGSERLLDELLDRGHSILLDSGIFWLTNEHKRATGCTMDEALALPPEQISGFGELYERYLFLTRKYGQRLWGYIELDQGGAVNKRRTRGRLHAEGVTPIPVYHPLNDGWEYFDEIASTHDRMCFGNIVQASRPVRVRLLHTLWERHRQYPHLWVHVLGMTASELCVSLPPDSCDSSAWVSGLRWSKLRTEHAAMRALGDMGGRFRYVRGHHSHPDLGGGAAMQLYADSMTQANTTWHDIVADAEALGAPRYPPQDARERMRPA